jgi:hypothetical protein
MIEMGSQLTAVDGESWELSQRVESAIHFPSVLASVESNPVLSSWYFTDRTCQRIESLWDWSQYDIAFLGTPRLYEWFAAAGLGKRRLLVELDELVVSKLRPKSGDEVMLHDLRDELPAKVKDRFSCVICDPPWYLEDYAVWLRRASELARGGVLCVSLLPELTRARATEERDTICRLISGDRESITILTEFLEYQIPTFERYQLDRLGFEQLTPWRLSDLVIGRASLPPKQTNPSEQFDRRLGWQEADLGALRIFVRESGSSDGGIPFLRAVADSAFLPSPSRQVPDLPSVNILTSRGHGLVCSQPRRFLEMVRGLMQRNVAAEQWMGELSADLDVESVELFKQLFR